MKIGFDDKTTYALVVHGYPIDGLTWAQCVKATETVTAFGEPFVAAPNGDLSETGTPNAKTPDETACFTFVLGVLVAKAKVKASQDAKSEKTEFDDKRCAAAAKTFESNRARIDEALAKLEIEVSSPPGLFVLAAGPLACAQVEGSTKSSISRLVEDEEPEDAGTSLEVTYDADPDAVHVALEGSFVLSARYS